MLGSLIAAFRLHDLRNRILFVFGMFAVFVLGLHIPVPGIDRAAMERLFSQGGLLGFIDVFSGGALKKFSIFAMGIMPYINASIIFQLLAIAIPQIEALQKEGEYGRKKISQWTRYLTIILALLQGSGLMVWLRGMQVVPHSMSLLGTIEIVLTLTAGTAFLMWVGEQITDKGIGNGVSLVIFAGIMARMPNDVSQTISLVVNGSVPFMNVVLLAVIFVGTVVGIVYIQQGQRKIPVQYAKRVVGTRMMGGSSTYLPLKINQAGVIPIIFAVSVALFPATIAQFAPVHGKVLHMASWLPFFHGMTIDLEDWSRMIVDFFTPGHSGFASLFYGLLVIGFTYFYTAVTFNPVDVADNLKKYGGFIPGIRPGRPTAEYLDRVLTRVTLAGAVFLAVIALMQYWVPTWTRIPSFQLAGGTSLLIVVGVALETMQQIEAQLLMRHYEGFIK